MFELKNKKELDIILIENMNSFASSPTDNKLRLPFSPLFFGLYLALCAFVIIVALMSAWKIGLAVLFLSFFLITAYKDQWNIYLLFSICIISFLELSTGIRLGSAAGASLMNMALLLSFLYLIVKNLKTEKRFFQRSIFNWPLLLLGSYKVVSLLFTYLEGEYTETLPVLLAYLKNEIDPFLIFIIAFNLPNSKRDIRIIVHFLLIFIAFIVFINVLNYYVGIEFLSFADVGLGYKEIFSGPYQPGFRLTGLFKDPNTFASFLILFSALTITTIFYAKKLFFKSIAAVFLFFQIFTLVLTGSRGGYVGFSGLVLLLFFIAVKKKYVNPKQAVIYAGLMLVLMATVFSLYRVPFMENVLGRLQAGNIHNVITISSRLELWKTGFSEFLRAPLFGHGWKNFVDVHNSYIYYLVTLGIVGFGLYIFIYANIFLRSWRCLDSFRFDTKNYILAGFIAGLGGILLVMNFIGIYYVYHYLFFYAGIVMKFCDLTKSPAPHGSKG